MQPLPPPRRFNPVRWLFDPRRGSRNRFLPRWLFLRALALIYFSAFFPLLFQIEGLNGPNGILPAGRYLNLIHDQMGPLRFWYAPTLFWFSSTSFAMMAIVVVGLIASAAALFNLWPRLSFFVCFLCFMSFVTAAQDFSSYQSDSMLLEAGFISLFFAPQGWRPRWGAAPGLRSAADACWSAGSEIDPRCRVPGQRRSDRLAGAVGAVGTQRNAQAPPL